MPGPGVGPGGTSGGQNQNQSLEDNKGRQDFSVMVVFSSLSYTTFCGWLNEQIIDKRKPNESKVSVLNKAWSCPEGDGYGPCDELIFIDCGSNDISKFKDSDGSELKLTPYISYAIRSIIELLYNKSMDGLCGKVTFKLLAVHPCQKCMFALSELLGNALPRQELYSSFVSHIMSQDEYRLAFRWIQLYGWLFNVVYCAVFDPFESYLKDTKGIDLRTQDMEKLLDKPEENAFIANYITKYSDPDHKFSPSLAEARAAYQEKLNKWENEPGHRKNAESGKYQVEYDGKWVDYDYMKDEYKRLTDPSEEELEKQLADSKTNLTKVKAGAESEKARIDRAQNTQHQHDIGLTKGMVKNLKENSAKYKGKSDQEIEDALYNKSLTGNIKKKKFNTVGFVKSINPVEEYSDDTYVIDGVVYDDDGIEKLKENIVKRVAAAQKDVELAQAALKEKQMAFVNGVLDAIQLVAGIGSLAFPPLALVDAYLTVARWTLQDEHTVKGTVLGIAGVAMDIAGLIPYFGTVARLSKGIARSSSELLEEGVKAGTIKLRPVTESSIKKVGNVLIDTKPKPKPNLYNEAEMPTVFQNGRKIQRMDPNEELEIVYVGPNNFDYLPPETQAHFSKLTKSKDVGSGVSQTSKDNPFISHESHTAIQDETYANQFVTVKNSNGELLTVELNNSSAVELLGKRGEKNLTTVKAGDLGDSVKKTYAAKEPSATPKETPKTDTPSTPGETASPKENASASESGKTPESGTEGNNSGGSAADAEKDPLKGMENEIQETAKESNGTLASEAMNKENLKDKLNRLFESGILTKPGLSVLDKAKREAFHVMGWDEKLGVILEIPTYLLLGYSGFSFFTSVSGIDPIGDYFDPKTAKLKAEENMKVKKPDYDEPTENYPPQRIDAKAEYDKATEDLKKAQDAKKKAKTDKEWQEAHAAELNAKKRQEAAHRLGEAQESGDYAREHESSTAQVLTDAQKDYQEKYNDYLIAKGINDRNGRYQTTLNDINNSDIDTLDINQVQGTSTTIQNLNYLQSMNYLSPNWAADNFNEAQENLEDSKLDLDVAEFNVYGNLMQQVEEQVATQDMNNANNYPDHNTKKKKK